MAAKLYLIYGDEFMVSSKAKKLVDSLVPPAERTFGLEVIDGAADNADAAIKAVDTCSEAVQTVGFMGSSKVVWFRDVNFLSDTVTGRSILVKERVEKFAALIKHGLPQGQVLVVTSPKVDKRYAFYKACKEAGEIQEFAVADKSFASEKQAAQMAQEFFRNAGLKVNQQVVEMFIGKVGTDTRQILNEVEKLAVYMGGRKDVAVNDVKEIVSSSREALAWDLADAFGKRDLKLAIEVSRQLLFQKENAIGIIIAMENRVKELMIYREAVDNGWFIPGRGWGNVPQEFEEIFKHDFKKDPRVGHPFRMGLLAEQAKRFSPGELSKCRKDVMDAHEKLVSSGVPDDIVLELMLVGMIS